MRAEVGSPNLASTPSLHGSARQSTVHTAYSPSSMKIILFVAGCLSILGGCASGGLKDPASPQAPATWIRTDAAVYQAEDTVHVTVTNISSVSLIGGQCATYLEEWTGDHWAESPYQPIASQACPDLAVILGPSASYTLSLPLGTITDGLFRFRLDDLNRSTAPALANDQRLTNAFRVQ